MNRKKTYFIILFLITFFISGCGGGGSSDDKDTPLQLSVTSAKPGAFISVEHNSIRADRQATLKIYYPGNSQALELESAYTDAGIARFVVPPFFDSDTSEYSSGTVRMDLVGTSATSDFQIEAPTDLGTSQQGYQPGYVMAWMLGESRDKYANAITELSAASQTYGVDTSELQSQLSDHIALLDASITEIQTQGQLTMVQEDGTVLVMGADELRQNDQLFFAIASGFADEYQELVPTTSPILRSKVAVTRSGKVNLEDLPPHVREPLQKMGEGFIWASENGGKLGAAFLGGVGLVVTIKGSLVGLPIIMFSAVGYVIVDGAVGEGLNSLADKLGVNNSGGYQFGDKMLESAEEALQGFALSLGGIKSQVVDFIGTVFNGKSIYDAFGIEKCDALENPPQEKFLMAVSGKTNNFLHYSTEGEFCSSLETETTGISIPIIGPLVLSTEQAGSWAYAIYGGTAPYSVSVNWGDGSVDEFSTSLNSGSLSHSYTDDDQYFITINITGTDGDTGVAATLVQVEDTVDSITATVNLTGHLSNYSFQPDLAFSGFSTISDGNSVTMDEIPTVMGYKGTLGSVNMEVMSLSLSKYLGSFELPLTLTDITDSIGDFENGVSDIMFNFNTPQITDVHIGSQVVFSAVGGSVTVTEYGTQLGDRISGTFNLQLHGERDLCPDPPDCQVVSDEIITGTAIGSFSGTLKLDSQIQLKPTFNNAQQ